MSANPIISIIVPVYGVENYIVKCIKSLKAQIFTDFEVLLINDETMDASIERAEKAIASDGRFKILHKKNGGQGSARNLGLDKAQGEYIAFVDSDDWVEPDYLEAMHTKIIAEDADICVCNVNVLSEEGRLEKIFRSDIEKYLEEQDFLNAHFYISNWIWDKLFRREVFEGMRFDPKIRTFEDAHFVFKLVYNKKITQTEKKLYNYVQHQGSTSNDIKPSYLENRLAVYRSQLEFARKISIKDEDYLNYLYLKTFIFLCITSFARFSKQYRSDIGELKKKIDYDIYTLRNILIVAKQEKKIGYSLLLFRVSPWAFRTFVHFWFRKKLI